MIAAHVKLDKVNSEECQVLHKWQGIGGDNVSNLLYHKRLFVEDSSLVVES